MAAYTHNGDGELVSEMVRAATVFQNSGDVKQVDLAGFHLQRTQHDTWRVWTNPEDDDPVLVDELAPQRFKSAQVVLRFLQHYERNDDEDDGEDTDEEENDGFGLPRDQTDRPGVI
jgi:hypothetical protein